MFAAHLAAGLALKSQVPRAPTSALLVGAFLPDFVWISLATVRLEPTGKENFFDDWSHSLATTTLWGILFAACFWKFGRGVMFAIWGAVMSHFLLDLPVHPKALGLFPHASVRLSLGLGQVPRMQYWLLQLAITVVLLILYGVGARRRGVATKPIMASCAYVLAFHLLMLPST